MSMRQNPLGRTGLNIPELVLGGGFVGGVMIDPPPDVRRQALDMCLDAGCDWVDTATSYGQGQSETNIGALLAEMPAAKRPRISSKIGLKRADMADPKGAVRRAIEASLSRLKLDRVEVYQLHNRIGHAGGDWLSPYDVLRPGGVADAFAAIKEDGLAGHVGFTALGDPGPIRDVMASERFETAQVYYNMLNPSAGRNVRPSFGTTDFRGLLGACKAHGLGVFAIRILAAGVLATEARHGRELPVTLNAEPGMEEARAKAAWAAIGPRNEPHAATAARFALAEPRISAAVFGAATIEHVEIALSAAAAGPLEPEAIRRLHPLYA